MSRFKEKNSSDKNFLSFLIIIVFTSVVSIFLYDMYINADTYGTEVKQMENIVTKEVQELNLEGITETIVGVSKIKNMGSSIFSQNSTTELGLGTGVIVSEDGYIVSNWHVTGEKQTTCYITLNNGKVYSGTVVWSDKDLDLSLVKIDRKGLIYMTLGNSDNIKLGEDVYAIGNPIGFEFQGTVTKGVISGKNRTIKIQEDENYSYMEDLIQTDATINPGNSGGALVDSTGTMIGINTIKISAAEGIGFAIPINIVKPILNSFIKSGTFNEAYIGIFGYDKEAIPYLDSTVNFESGIYVAKVTEDGPSSFSGIKIGDIICSVDNIEINKMVDLRSYIYTKSPNDTVSLKVLRNNKQINIQITLGERK